MMIFLRILTTLQKQLLYVVDQFINKFMFLYLWRPTVSKNGVWNFYTNGADIFICYVYQSLGGLKANSEALER